MTPGESRDIFVRKYNYTRKRQTKIRQSADSYAEVRFLDLLKSKQITTAPKRKLKKEIVVGKTVSSIGNSLYEKEGDMNNLEERVIMEIGTSSNIAFCHRNLER